MGLSVSREKPLPPNIDNFRDRIVRTWIPEKILANSNNAHQETQKTPTQDEENIIKGALNFTIFLSKNSIIEPKVLEINSGNCSASKIFKDILNKTFSQITWISTDIIKFSRLDESIQFEQLNQIDAVEKFGCDSNILLTISPPPCSLRNKQFEELEQSDKAIGYGDYFAYHDFIAQTRSGETKYIVFIGELGAGDGSEGTYLYLIEHPNLTLELRKMLEIRQDMFTDGNVEKELFVFRIIT